MNWFFYTSKKEDEENYQVIEVAENSKFMEKLIKMEERMEELENKVDDILTLLHEQQRKEEAQYLDCVDYGFYPPIDTAVQTDLDKFLEETFQLNIGEGHVIIGDSVKEEPQILKCLKEIEEKNKEEKETKETKCEPARKSKRIKNKNLKNRKSINNKKKNNGKHNKR